MQENPNSKTVRGLGIATLVLAIIGILACIGVAIGVVAFGAVVDQNSAEISSSITENIQSEDFDEAITVEIDNDIDMDAEERAQLASALETLQGFDKEKTEGLVTLLTLIDEGDGRALYDALASDDGTLESAINSYTSLTDEELTQLAESAGALPSEYIELRDALSSIDASYASDITSDMLNGDIEISEGTVSGVNYALVGILLALDAIAFIGCLLALIAGVLAIKRSQLPAKLGSAFGLSIAAAVLAFFSGRIVSLVLLICLAVFIYKARNFDKQQPAAAQPAYAAPQPAPEFAAPSAPAVAPEPEAAEPTPLEKQE